MLLVHGIMKVMPMTENGFSATVAAFATATTRAGLHRCIERLVAWVINDGAGNGEPET